jgi:hypothetical protein
MQSLIVAIPDVNTLLALEPEELGAKILFLLRKTRPDPGGFFLGNLIVELWPPNYLPKSVSQYPREKVAEVNQAISEAWAWLEAQGLLIPAPDTNGASGWRLLSRRARELKQKQNSQIARLPGCFRKKSCIREWLTVYGERLCAASTTVPCFRQ